MGENKGLEGEIKLPGGSFSRLLLSSDDNVEEKPLLLCVNSSVPHQTPLFSNNTPKMLCFGDFNSKNITPKPTFTTVVNDTSKESKPTFTKLNDTNNNLITHISNNNNNNKRRNGSGKESGHGSGNGQKNGMMKKNKPEMGPVVTSSLGHAKARREKLGERISVLQQLVCPYGKTDTASVLHEAMGYIRFLHDQVKVLSTPYLKRLPSSWSSLSPHQSINENGATAKDSTDGLKDMGLCLVPLEYILQVASSNGADFWPPTNISSSGV